MIIIIFVIFSLVRVFTLDLYISQSAFCDNNDCLGTKNMPFSNFSQALPFVFTALQSNISDNIINVLFQGEYYIWSNKSFPENTTIFIEWEILLARSLTINLRPESCTLDNSDGCKFFKILFKTQKNNIFMPSFFNVNNLIFDWSDSLLDYDQFMNNECYLNEYGCCFNQDFNNASSDCNANISIVRNNDGFINQYFIGGNGIIVFKNVVFQNFYDVKPEFYYQNFIEIFSYAKLLMENVTFQGFYFRESIIKITGDSQSEMNNVFFNEYNPFLFYENLPNLEFSYLLWLDNGNSQSQFSNILVNNSQFFLYANNEHPTILVNCTFALKIATTWDLNYIKNLGFFRLLPNSSLNLNNCSFSNYFEATTKNQLNKMSLFALDSFVKVYAEKLKFNNFNMKEGRLFYGFSNNEIILIDLDLRNLVNSCGETSSNCVYDLISFESGNNFTLNNSIFKNITINYATVLMKFIETNTIIFSNVSFYLIYNQNVRSNAFFYFSSQNNINWEKTLFLNYTVASGGNLIQILMNNNFFYTEGKFLSNPWVGNSQVLSFYSYNNATITSVTFQSFNSYYPSSSGVMSYNQINFNNCYLNQLLAVYGTFMIVNSNYNVFNFSSSIISSLTSALTGGFVYFLGSQNSLLFYSCKIINIYSYSNAGFAYYGSAGYLSFQDTVIVSSSASTSGGIVESMANLKLYAKNLTILSAKCKVKGGAFSLSNTNIVTILDSFISGGYTSNGQGGIIYAFSGNQITINNSIFSMNWAESGGGVFYLDNNNIIFMNNCSGTAVSSGTDAGFGFLKRQNQMTVYNSTFFNLSSGSSGSFMLASKLNIISIFNSVFFNSSASKEGGLVVLNNNNSFYLKDIEIINISASLGGAFKVFSDNIIEIETINIKNIQVVSQGGFIWLMTLNILKIKDSIFFEILSFNGEGGLIYSYQNNTIVYQNSYAENISANPEGGVFYGQDFNNFSIEKSNFSNCSVGDGQSTFIYLGFFNNLVVKYIIYEGLDNVNALYFGMNNQGEFAFNIWKFLYCANNKQFLYSNYTNFINISKEKIVLENSNKNLLIDLIYLFDKNTLYINDSEIVIDLVSHYFIVYSQSFLYVSNMKLKNSLSLAEEIIVSEYSTITLHKFYFIFNQFLTVIKSSYSTIKIQQNYYQTNQSNSLFIVANFSTLYFKNSYFSSFKSSNENIGIFQTSNCQIFFSKNLVFGFFNQNNGSVGHLNSSNLTVKTCFFFNNEAKYGGVFFSNDLLRKNLSLKLIGNILANNKAFDEGGVLKTISSGTDIKIEIKYNYLIFNKALNGGAFNLGNLKEFFFGWNKACYNRVLSVNKSKPSKGGVLYVINSDEMDFSLNFSFSDNKFEKNKANIGGVLFLEGIKLDYFKNLDNIFQENSADFYGNELASDINTIRFDSLETSYAINSKIKNDYFSATIEKIKTGYPYPNCLLKIIGFDRFNTITYKTDEKILDKLQFTQQAPSPSQYSNIFYPTYQDGAVCFNGSITRNSLPINLDFNYLITSFFPLSQKEKFLFLNLNFGLCNVGDRLNYNLDCVACSKETYSFQKDFSTYSDTCKLCFSENFYCFGGGNITVKPGYWRIAQDSYIFYRCPNSYACLGDPRNFSDSSTNYLEIYSSSNCEIGYSGVLCSECQEGYGFLDGHICVSCENSDYYLQVFGNILIRLVFTIYLVNVSLNMCISLTTETPNKNRIIASNLLKIFTNHVQILGIIFGLPLSFPPELTEGGLYLLNISPNVSEAFSIECLLKKMNVNISLQYFKLMLSGVYPFCILGLYVFFLKLVTKINSKIMSESKLESHIAITVPNILQKKKLNNRDLAFTVFGLVALISYPDIAKITLDMFGCVDVGDGKYTRKLLYSDFRIDCNSNYHKLWIKQAATPILIFFLFIFPIFWVGKMYYHLLRKEDGNVFNFRFGYFFYAYKREFFYWDFVILLRKLILIFMNAYFFSRITDKVDYYPITLVIIIITLAFLLQIYFKPFRKDSFHMINRLEEYSLIISFSSVTIALLYMITSSLNNSIIVLLFILAFLMNISFFVLWIRSYYLYYAKDKIKNFGNHL